MIFALTLECGHTGKTMLKNMETPGFATCPKCKTKRRIISREVINQ